MKHSAAPRAMCGPVATLPTRWRQALARGVIVCFACGVPGVAWAQAPPPPAEPAEPAEPAAGALGAEWVKTGLYLLSGGGSSTLMRLSASGTVLVDGKLAGQHRALMSQVRKLSKLSDLPVRALFITDHHAHHTGNHAQFLAAGMAVIAQQNALPRLPPGPSPGPASSPSPGLATGTTSGAKPGAPVVSFDRAYTLHIGGVEVHSLHFGRAHTDSDAVVYFPDLKVVAVGDLVSPGAPLPDFAAGGSLVGWGPVLEQVLTLDFDIAVPSVGAPMGRAELLAFKARVDLLTARATALLNSGVARDQWPAQLAGVDPGWRLDLSADQLDALHADLLQAR